MARSEPTVTIVQMSPDQLQAMLDQAVRRAIEGAAEKSGELWGVKDLADHYGVSGRTIRNWELAGNLPARTGTRWRRADILRFDRDRRPNFGPVTS